MECGKDVQCGNDGVCNDGPWGQTDCKSIVNPSLQSLLQKTGSATEVLHCASHKQLYYNTCIKLHYD